ncbi:hypothetical protein [uncultured Desulfovibrio sp.]|uniref:hypothetical protein n=1 Tax=uncultured Desulfovibrio sp. TaxID=167968 RepID=UPI0026340D8C|nr:hypothetical protein [uncultured Desulfovibrio sp.]
MLFTRKTRYFSHNSFGTKRDTANAWFLQQLFPQPERPQERTRPADRGPEDGAGGIRHDRAAGAGRKKDPLLLCMENGRTSMEKTGQGKSA